MSIRRQLTNSLRVDEPIETVSGRTNEVALHFPPEVFLDAKSTVKLYMDILKTNLPPNDAALKAITLAKQHHAADQQHGCVRIPSRAQHPRYRQSFVKRVEDLCEVCSIGQSFTEMVKLVGKVFCQSNLLNSCFTAATTPEMPFGEPLLPNPDLKAGSGIDIAAIRRVYSIISDKVIRLGRLRLLMSGSFPVPRECDELTC